MELSHIYVHIFMVHQASYLNVVDALLEQGPPPTVTHLQEMEEQEFQVDSNQSYSEEWNYFNHILYRTFRSKRNNVALQIYGRLSERGIHRISLTTSEDVKSEVFILSSNCHLVFQYLEKNDSITRTRAINFQTNPFLLNSKKTKRNNIYSGVTDAFIEKEDRLYHSYSIYLIEYNTCKYIVEKYFRIVLAAKEHIGRFLNNERNEGLLNEIGKQAVLMLVFSMILICQYVLVRASIQKERIIQPQSKYSSNMEGKEMLPSFIFEVRIFPHKTLNILPYGGRNDIDMSNYLHRLGTFKDKTKTIQLRPHQLASDGFYALENPGQTKCYSCGFVYSEWISGDDPRKIHLQNSPNCPFIRHHIELLDGKKKTRVDTKITPNDHKFDSNGKGKERDKQRTQLSEDRRNTEEEEKVDRDLTSSSKNNEHHEQNESRSIQDPSGQPRNDTLYSIPSFDQCRSSVTHISRSGDTDDFVVEIQAKSITRRSRRSINEYNQQNDRPLHPQYAVLTVRLSSFQGYPCYVSQSPRQLAMAGFFYLGYSDGVQCYFCGGKLTNWEDGDDPFVEHAKWFPMCLFLREVKGEEFILLVKETYRNELDDSQKSKEQSTDENENIFGNSRYGNHAHQDGLSGGIERSLPVASEVSNHYAISESSKYQGSFVTSTGAESDSVSNTTSNPITSASGNMTHHSMTKLVSQMFKTSVTEHLEDSIEKPSGSDRGSLFEENRRLRDQRLCKVCLDQDSSIAFLPCGHLVCCPQCAPAIRKCPICRQMVKGSIKTWLG